MRRRAQSDDRRRRMLVDETSCEPHSKGATPRSGSARATYAPDTLERQPQCIDFLPRRLWLHPLLWASSLLIVAGLVVLHHWQAPRTDGPWEIFQLEHPSSLATWLSAIGLVGIGVLAINIFSLRRFRKSDYHTRYRWWIWIGVTALVSSLAVATGVHQVVARTLATTTAWNLPGGHQLFWLIPVGCLYTCLAIRLGFEFRHCRIAMGGLVTAWLAICVKGLLLFGFQLGMPGSWQLVLRDGSTPGMVALLGCVFLWYARHVLLDIEGRLPVQRAKKKTKKDATASSSSVTPSHATTAQPKGRSDLEPDVSHRAAELVEESVYTPEESEDEEPTRRRSKDARKRNGGTRGQAADEEEIFEHRTREQQRKISKAERKRRRKLKAKERHAA
ncbi:MAG: hypothetical protein VXZ84_04905 [Planctomycetota bacterium]|nr:hypothetical protein [Planctomycetota bacterium]